MKNELKIEVIIWNQDAAAAAAKLLQSCLTLCDPIDGSPPGPTVPRILQQEHWSGLPFPSFSHAWKWKVKVKSLTHVRLLATPWTAAYQVPPSVGFSRQEYWSGLPLPSPETWIDVYKSRLKSFEISPGKIEIGELWS